MSFLGEIQAFKLTDSQSHTLTCVPYAAVQTSHNIAVESSPRFTVCSPPAVRAGVDLCFRGANRQLCDRTVCLKKKKEKRFKCFWLTYEVKLLKLKQS